MTKTELLEILGKHRKWLAGEAGGQRANLRGANLRGADLSRADLSGADLSGADLSRADLSGADLSGADLSGADLRYSDLRYSDLSGADLIGADLRYSDLIGADLRGADLNGADLRGVNLYNCCLPLWCGGLHIKLDRRQMVRLIYHFCSMDCDDSEVIEMQKSMYAFANEFAESRSDLKNKKFPEER